MKQPKKKSERKSAPAPGQEICFFANSNHYFNDSMSSLESFMSFEDDNSVEEEEPPKKPTPAAAKRTKPRRHNRVLNGTPPVSPPTRCKSAPEVPSKRKHLLSRWDNMPRSNSCEPSPAGHATGRVVRRVPGKEKPATISQQELDAGGSGHDSVGSFMLETMLGADRWAATSSSHHHSNSAHTTINNSAHNSSFGTASFAGNSSGRWQDSCHAESSCLSRWSASLTSSQMEQASTRPRVPTRKRSTRVPTLVQGNGSIAAATVPSTEDASSTARATMGSDDDLDDDELSSTGLEQDKIVVVDCSLFFSTDASASGGGATDPPPPPTLKSSPAVVSAKKPRPQLPHRQKSFGRGMSMGMAAKAAMVANNRSNRRKDFVKQQSEPSIGVDRQPSDLSITSRSSHVSTTADSIINSTPAPAETGPLAALRKQRSLSSLLAHQEEKEQAAVTRKENGPQLPERQKSRICSTRRNGSRSPIRRFRKQKSLSSLHDSLQRLDGGEADDGGSVSSTMSGRKRAARDTPQLPQRVPSDNSGRRAVVADDNESVVETEPYDSLKKPQRQVSCGSMTLKVAAAALQQQEDLSSIIPSKENNRRLSLTKQMSEPSALSLKNLLRMGSLHEQDVDLDQHQRPTKRQALFALATTTVGGTNLLPEEEEELNLLPPSWKKQNSSSPEFGSSCWSA